MKKGVTYRDTDRQGGLWQRLRRSTEMGGRLSVGEGRGREEGDWSVGIAPGGVNWTEGGVDGRLERAMEDDEVEEGEREDATEDDPGRF